MAEEDESKSIRIAAKSIRIAAKSIRIAAKIHESLSVPSCVFLSKFKPLMNVDERCIFDVCCFFWIASLRHRLKKSPWNLRETQFEATTTLPSCRHKIRTRRLQKRAASIKAESTTKESTTPKSNNYLKTSKQSVACIILDNPVSDSIYTEKCKGTFAHLYCRKVQRDLCAPLL